MDNTAIFNLISEVRTQQTPFEVDIAHFEIQIHPENGDIIIEKSGLNRMNLMQIKDTIDKIQQGPLSQERIMQETLRILHEAEQTIEQLISHDTTESHTNIKLHEQARLFYNDYFAGKHITDRYSQNSSNTSHTQIKRILHLH